MASVRPPWKPSSGNEQLEKNRELWLSPAMLVRLAVLLLAFLGAVSCSRSPAPAPAATVRHLDDASPRRQTLRTPETAAIQDQRIAREPAPSAKNPLEQAGARKGGTPIHGNVVDVRTGLGLAQCKVVLRLGKDHRQSMQTSDDGRFAFVPEIDARSGTLFAWPPPGWRWRSSSYPYAERLTQEQLGGREEFRFEMAENRSGPVHGVAVAKKTGLPIPNFRFSIRSRAGYRSPRIVAEVVTDEQGRFETEEPVHGGRVTIQSGPGEGPPVAREQDCLVPGPWRIEFNVEPRMEIALSGAIPPDPTRLRFWVLPAGKSRAVSYSVLRQDPGGGLWVRPPTPRPDLPFGQRVVLAVGDEEGLLFAALPHVWGRESRTLLFDLAQTSVLDLAVEMAQPETIEERSSARAYPRILLTPRDERLFPGSMRRLSQRKWLPPGLYDLRVSSRIHAEERRTVELTGGEIEHLAIPLQLEENTRTVHGRIVTESGGSVADASVQMSLRESPASVWRASWVRNRMCGTGVDHFVTVGEENGHEVGRFTFENVPQGPVEIETNSFTVPSAVEMTESASGDLELEVIQLDVGEGSGLGFRVRSASEQEPPNYWVHSRPLDGGPALHTYAYDGRTIARGAPGNRRLEWAVVAPGYRTAYGDEGDFRPEGDGRFFADVKLERGWGIRVLVTDQDLDPLPGAEVTADGEVVGTTDASGCFEIHRATPPAAIEVKYMGWRPSCGFPPVPSPNALTSPWLEITLLSPEDGG